MCAESVWDYPRPPRLEASSKRVRVVLGDRTIVDTDRSLRVLETSHPPVHYVPFDVLVDVERTAIARTSHCEWKGRARYWSLRAGDTVVEEAGWDYPRPVPAYAALRDHLALYPERMGSVWLDDERVEAQPGGFYGGWVTADLVGPFKGAPGTMGW